MSRKRDFEEIAPHTFNFKDIKVTNRVINSIKNISSYAINDNKYKVITYST